MSSTSSLQRTTSGRTTSGRTGPSALSNVVALRAGQAPVLGRESARVAAACNRVLAEWERASADLDDAVAKLRGVRDLTDRCNAAYLPGGGVDMDAYTHLKAEIESRRSRPPLAAE